MSDADGSGDAGSVRPIDERLEAHRLARQQPDGNWAAKRRLAGALRALLDVCCATDAPEAELLELAETIERATARFRAQPRMQDPPGVAEASFTGMETFHDRSPMMGMANPMAPPAVLEVDREAAQVRGRVEFGNAYEGGPGLVHGGFLASLLDEALGMACTFSGQPGMTGELTVRYLAPTRIKVPLRLEAHFERVEGRKIWTTGGIFDGERQTVQARGLFISIDGAKFASFNAERKQRLGSDASGG